MSLCHRLRHNFFLLLLLFSPAAFANLQFNYLSQELPFIQGYLNGFPDDSVGLHEPPYPIFSFSSLADIQSNEAIFTGGYVQLSWPADNTFSDLGNFTAQDSYIRFNADGTPASWHLDLQLLKESSGGPWGPSRDFWRIQSDYGDNSCNCDSLWYEYDLYIQRPFDTWAYAATLAFENGGTNGPDSWQWAQAKVPEPWAIWLMALGLASIGAARERR